MKVKRILSAAAIAALVILSAGCKKHTFGEGEIRFTATSRAPQTKTAYSNQYYTDGSDKYERIDWCVGDKIVIAMRNDGGDEKGDYLINTATPDGKKSQAKLTPLGGQYGYNGLKWGEGQHSFVSIYPSPSVDENWPNEVGVESLVLSYPATQTLTPKGDSGADAMTLLPDMKYAYMYAELSNVAPKGQINLSFQPLFTAFEISISAGDNDDIELSAFRLVSLAEGEYPARTKDFWDDTNDTDESTTISVPLTGIHLLRDGDPLVFTIFAYADSYSHLKLEFDLVAPYEGTRTLDLVKDNGEGIRFDGFCKNRILGLYFPRLDGGSGGGQGINWNGTVGEDLSWNGAEGEDINWGGNKPYAMPGKFSVSATKQVQFARGNLVYKAGEWDFHKQQYDKCFKANTPLSFFGPDASFDLFGWATAGIAGADETMVNYQPWKFNYTAIDSQLDKNPYGYGPSIDNVPGGSSWDAYADYCDWGNIYKLTQVAGDGWYTLSAAEWAYLFTLRSASEVNGVANARFAKATVCGEPGLLLFPDDFGTRFTGDQVIFAANSINQMDKDASDFSDIVLSRTVWTIAEAAGSVFLPAAGAVVSYFGVTVNSASTIIGYYWSSTAATEVDKAMQIAVGSTVMAGSTVNILYLTGNAIIRGTGCSVRLVKLAE